MKGYEHRVVRLFALDVDRWWFASDIAGICGGRWGQPWVGLAKLEDLQMLEKRWEPDVVGRLPRRQWRLARGTHHG